jgi:hypothetical protein
MPAPPRGYGHIREESKGHGDDGIADDSPQVNLMY